MTVETPNYLLVLFFIIVEATYYFPSLVISFSQLSNYIPKTPEMTKSENISCFAFSETWWHLGIAQTSLALLSVCTSFPR